MGNHRQAKAHRQSEIGKTAHDAFEHLDWKPLAGRAMQMFRIIGHETARQLDRHLQGKIGQRECDRVVADGFDPW